MATDGTDRRAEVMDRLRTLVRELSDLTETMKEPGRYFPVFLEKVTTALAAAGGVIWLPTADGMWTPTHHIRINIDQLMQAGPEGVGEFHQLALREVAERAEPLMVAPGQTLPGPGSESRPPNQSAFLLLFSPILIEGEAAGVAEVLVDGSRSPQAYRGFLDFTSQMARQAATFLRRHQLSQTLEERRAWSGLLELQSRVHDSLDPARVAMNLANLGRPLTDADRISVGGLYGRKVKVLAVSGQDTIDHHGHLAKGTAALGRAVCRDERPVQYAADEADSTRQQRPADVSEALDQFVSAAECRHTVVMPLKTDEKAVGVLVAERVADPPFSETARNHLALMASEGAVALDNAMAYRSIPMLTVMRGLRWIKQRSPTRLVLVLLIAAVLTYVFGWVQGTLWLDGDAKIFPKQQRTIYVETAGIVEQVPVRHGQAVRRGDTLLVIRNRDLELKHAEAAAQRVRTQWSINQLESQHNEDPRDLQISGQLEQSRARLAGLVREHQLLASQLEQLKVVSPIDGIVTTLDVEEKLAGKPVEVGDEVLKVAGTDAWILKVYLPEDRMGDLLQAEAEASEGARQVKFYLASHPGRTFMGTVAHISASAEVVGEENVVVIRVNPDEAPEDVKPEMGARAKIESGRRALGYVWFRELIQFVQTRLLF